jgi:hypothetical protein
MRASAVVSLVTAAVLIGCAGHRHETVADTSALHSCEVRQLQFGNVAATVSANMDASLAEVDVSGGTDDERRAATRSAYRAFGEPKVDTVVRPVQSKWGLNTWVDRCGRTVTPHVAAPAHDSGTSSSR